MAIQVRRWTLPYHYKDRYLAILGPIGDPACKLVFAPIARWHREWWHLRWTGRHRDNLSPMELREAFRQAADAFHRNVKADLIQHDQRIGNSVSQSISWS